MTAKQSAAATALIAAIAGLLKAFGVTTDTQTIVGIIGAVATGTSHQVVKHAPKAVKKIKRRSHSSLITMYDSVTVSTIPWGARAVAGYVGGRWPTYHELVKRYPHSHIISIAIDAEEHASCLDVETGDASPDDCARWFHFVQGAIRVPKFYANRSTMPAVIANLRAHGIKREQYRLWIADPTDRPHIPPGYDACQYGWNALGRNLDVSLCHPSFFD